MALPTIVNVTAKQTAAGADLAITLSTHQENDILLVPVESANEGIALATANGFAEVPDSPQGTGTAGGTNGTRLALFWKRAANGSESAPTIEGSALNHLIAACITVRGCITTGDPWDVTAGDTGASSTSVAVPGDTTTGTDRLILAICSVFTDNNTGQFPNAWTNSDLANLTSILNIGTNVGNGGGLGAATGEKATAGSYGATTTTITNASAQGRISLALKPPAAAESQDVTLPTLASGLSLFALTLAYAVTLPALASGTQLFAPTVAPGPVTVELPTLGSSAQTFAPSAGYQVTLPTLASGAQVFAPTLAYDVALPHLASTVQLFTPTVIGPQSLDLPHLASGTQLFAPSTAYQIELPTLASTAATFAPSVAYAVNLPTLASSAQTFTPMLAYAVTLPHRGSTAVLFAPSLAYAITLPTLGSTASLFAPAVSYTQTITLPHLASGAVLYPLAEVAFPSGPPITDQLSFVVAPSVVELEVEGAGMELTMLETPAPVALGL